MKGAGGRDGGEREKIQQRKSEPLQLLKLHFNAIIEVQSTGKFLQPECISFVKSCT